MAGVPSIMQAMKLGEIAKANPGVAIGSYPFFDPQHGPNTNVVLRARDAQKLAQAKRAVEERIRQYLHAAVGAERRAPNLHPRCRCGFRTS